MSKFKHVLQHSEVDQFIHDLTANDYTDLVCVWPATFARPTSPHSSRRYTAVTAQAIAAFPHAGPVVIQVSALLGAYETVYSNPFGPSAERQAGIIEEELDTAVARLREHLQTCLPALDFSTGQVHTGLTGPDIQIAYWSGFDDIYARLKEAKEAYRE